VQESEKYAEKVTEYKSNDEDEDDDADSEDYEEKLADNDDDDDTEEENVDGDEEDEEEDDDDDDDVDEEEENVDGDEEEEEDDDGVDDESEGEFASEETDEDKPEEGFQEHEDDGETDDEERKNGEEAEYDDTDSSDLENVEESPLTYTREDNPIPRQEDYWKEIRELPTLNEPKKRAKRSVFGFPGRTFPQDWFGMPHEQYAFPKLPRAPVVDTSDNDDINDDDDDAITKDDESEDDEEDDDDDEYDPFKTMFGSDIFGNFKDIVKKTKEVHEKIIKGFETPDFKIPEIKWPEIKIPGIKDFGGKLGSNLFKSILKEPLWKTLGKHIEETVKTIGTEVEKMTKSVEETLENTAGCVICKTIVAFVTWEIKTVNASVETIEKAVKAMCKLYPIKVATEVCDEIVDDIDTIIQLVENRVEPDKICEQLKLCNATNLPVGAVVSVFTSVSPLGDCSPLCKFMKGLYEENVMKTAHLWTATKEKLLNFCEDNKIKAKCNKLVYMFAKAERQLSRTITKEEGTEDDCTCFKRQPILRTKANDMCQMCQQFEQGLINDLKEANATMNYLADTLEQLCEMLPSVQDECSKIVKDFRTAFIHLEDKLKIKGVCKVIGFCKNETLSAKKMITSLKDIFPGGNPLLLGGKPMGFGFGDKKFSHGCKFCKTCMDNLEETFSHTNDTNILPYVKEGLDIFCETMGDGEVTKTVCKTITDGMTMVRQVITKTKDSEGTCKLLGIC